MTGSTQTFPYTSPGPIRLPPGNLETVEEMPGDSDLEDERSDMSDSLSDMALSNIEEEGEDYDDEGEEGSMRERDPVFEKIKETLSKSHQRSESAVSMLSSISDESDGPHVQISEHYTSVPYGIQPRATYEHSSLHADIMGVAYNGRMRMFVILDSKGITTWKRDLVDPRDMSFPQAKDLTPKTFNLNQVNEESTKKKMIKKKSVVTLKQHYFVRRALQYPKYEYRLIMHVVYAPKYNCYFALGKDFSVKVLNRDFEETCSVNTDMRSVLYILFNPVRDELITGGVGGIKIWQFQQAAGKAFTELKPLANYELRIKETLPNVGGSWVKKVELDHHLQHLYCCSDTDLHVYDLTGKLLFKFERAHTMSITGACFSPSAKVLVTSSVDSEVKIWSLNGGLVHTFRGHSRAVTGLLLHPETSSILITSSLDGSIRMWSLDTMDLLYMIVVSADGVMWMGLTDDKLLYISTCRNITLWHLNNFFTFWSLARNQVSSLSLASCQEKTTRVLAVGEDSSVRIFCRSNRKNITTVLPPPDISPLQKVLSVCYSREKNAAFLLITNREIWVYTTRTDPSCRIAIWDVHDLQLPYISGDTSNLPPGVIIQPPSQSVITHRATENGNGNEIISNCCSLCILNSTAMMMTDEGLSCPIRHTYLLLGMEDGRILFMDPVIKGQKYMELKASKDSIQEMRHDVAHSSLITLCRLKTLVMIQIWGLPQLDAMYEVYCGPDVTCYSRVGLSILTGHTSGQVNIHSLEPVEDQGILISKQEPQFESIVDEKRRPEHQGPVVAMDALASLQIYVTCSSDGGIKIWDENKVLLTEVMLEESLSAATFLNEMGDLLVAFKNHIFYIDHSKLCPAFKPPEIEMETSDQESDVYEDPRVLYEMIRDEEEPVTLENYLVPYDHIEFDKDFLEGKTRIEQPKTVAEAMESSETETETDISLAPSSIYLSPAESIESLSMIDLTLGADYSKYDLREQMKATLDYMGTKATERDKWKDMPAARVYLKLRRIQIANAKTSKYVYRKKPRGKKRQKNVTIETLAQSDMEDKEIEMELEKFSLPIFGDSPGGSPSITPPSGQASLRKYDQTEEADELSEEEKIQKKPSGFVPIVPDQAGTPAGKIEKPLAEYQQAEEGAQTKRLKGVKVDVRGLMKKRRITSGRAPSLTRRASADHTHDDHDHDHDHGHDDKRKKDINKKQMKDDRKILPPRTIDREKLMNLPPNPPSMLTRKHSLTDQRKLELNLLHRPDIHRPPEHTDPSLAQVHYDENQPDADQLQEEQWASEAAVHGQPLTLPPQKDKSRARVLDKNDPRSYRNRDRKGLGDDRKNSLEGHTPGVGSSPTAELEKEDTSVGKDENSTVKKHDKATSIVIEGTSDGEQHKSESKDDDMEVINLDTNTPETQMQRTKRLGLKLDSDKVFENDKTEKSNSVPRVLVRRSKLNVYIPQAGADRESISSAKSSRRGTPDSGIDDSVSTLGRQTPQTPRVKLSGDKGQEDDLKLDQELPAPDSSLLSEEDKANAIRRPASSFTGLRRGQLEGERLNAERPHTAHVRFKAEEYYFYTVPWWVSEDLQTAFEQALQKYQNLPGTPAVVSADTLYRNDGTKFEDNWQERVIERHTLLRMQKEIRAQSAAQRRQAMEVIQKDKNSAKLFTSRCDSAIGGFTDRDSSIQSVRRANTSMSVPISLSYGVGSVPPPTRDKPRPKTANPALEKQQMTKLELSHEKSFRFRLSNTGQTSPRPESSRSISSVADFSPHWIDPRNPDAWRPKSSRSIPSKCNRYVLVNKPKEKITKPLPSPLEEQLLVERFPKLSAKIVPPVSELTPRMKKSYNLEYSPFVYHRFV
ncbi:uncharacterized protein LOC123529192 isoform X8 [Mercenaria mercenaria]|uniref:uncharacterized protein LOC123529192 isoform X8 n=1 Tax=Mercenaria mercenaria TaxID=6596 RepID=UPI00234F7931|nr:uncharacterized protein LOC123529192 isoform X8 [Mercenaria mercenaria]